MFTVLAALAGNSVGCGGDSGASGALSDQVTIPRPASLFLQVSDVGGAPIPLAVVMVQGTIQTTDGAGRLLLEGLPTGRFVARVEARGFAPASAVVDLPEGAHGGTEVRLHPLGQPIPLDAQKGGTIEKAGVRVVIPPASLVTEDGEYVTGMVEATVVPLDPTSRPLFSPVPLEGVSLDNGEVVGLDSGFMAEVSLWKEGRRLQLAPGAKAKLAFPLPDAVAAKYSAGDVIEAWWVDLDGGRFREDGAGTLQESSTEPGKLEWVVDVEHFTWWNCDAPWTDKNCFNVTVKDAAGMPVQNASLSAEGVSYIDISAPKFTDVNGKACISIKLGESATLLVGGKVSPLATVPVTGSGPASSCNGFGAPCKPVDITLAPPLCVPGSFKKCSYSGPPGTEGVGICKAAHSFCDAAGVSWLPCDGEVIPLPETCLTPFDDDCDGKIPPLSDGNACTADICAPNGAITHSPVNTSDNNACTKDGCNQVTGIYHTPVTLADISDGNVCTIDWCDPAKGKMNSPFSVDDGKPCTADTCDPVSGPMHINICPNDPCVGIPLDDNNACTIDACDSMTGVVSHTLMNPEDGDLCTTDVCDPMLGTSHLPVDASDGNACTIDYCDPQSGVHNDPNPGINDNNACTQDLCDPATGTVTNPPKPGIDDNNACTQNICDPQTGNVTHPPVPGIDDNDACTQDFCDPQTGTVTHPPKPGINDNDACTQDFCDPVTGNVTNPPNPDIDDNNACTTDTCNPQTGEISNTVESNKICPQSDQFDPDLDCRLKMCDPATGNPCGLLVASVFLETFADNLNGWTFTSAANAQDLWEIGPAQSSAGHNVAGPDPATDWDPTGDNGIAGVNIGGNASASPHGFYYLTSPEIDMASLPSTEPVFLSFQRWLNSAAPFENTVEVWDGFQWVELEKFTGTINDTAWTTYFYVIGPYMNQFFQVRFGFSVGNGAPTISSWNIDHIRIGREPSPWCGFN
ncbi:MAG TPA: carboxypeptidase-like regulatory domain-containing protein [Polyangiaceae bacterium]|nr:carboxypeptidase-like regulatory domain-containing protein [Polyangiaceae bacterium]